MPLDQTELLRQARQYAIMARDLHAEGNDTANARRAQRKAEQLYERAGLDDGWHDPEQLADAQVIARPRMIAFHLPDQCVELTDNHDPSHDVTGLMARREDLVDLQP